MDRRNFMKLVGLSGLALATPVASDAFAAEDNKVYKGNFFIAFVANGGWDVCNLCDPKGQSEGVDQAFATGDILTAGKIKYAPIGANESFFKKFKDDLLVINGIDTITNGHSTGSRYAGTGQLTGRGYPTFAALFAAKKSEGLGLPLAYLSYGGYSATGNLLPVSRLGSTASIERLGESDFEGGNLDRPYLSEFGTKALAELRAKRRSTQLGRQNLPKINREMGTLFAAQLSASKLKKISEYLPNDEELNSLRGAKRSAAVVMAACKAGLCISANLSVGGFDTHGDHENRQNDRLTEYTETVEYLMERAEALGIRDRVVLMMASEFSRTPKYNDDQGKDHWPVASMMFMGPGIKGNRVIGATDENHQAKGFDPAKMKPIDDKTLRIRPHHIHNSLRRLTGIDASDEAVKFVLQEPEIEIDFFS